MSSALLVFDFRGGNAALERKRNARGFIQPEFNGKESGQADRRRKELVEFWRVKSPAGLQQRLTVQ
jgi:hypothetical protein